MASGDVWPGAPGAAPYGAPAASYQPYDPYSLPPEPDMAAQGLPPMSSFRANGGPSTNQYSAQDSIGKALGAVSRLLSEHVSDIFIILLNIDSVQY